MQSGIIREGVELKKVAALDWPKGAGLIFHNLSLWPLIGQWS
jgi:hypothetical protein